MYVLDNKRACFFEEVKKLSKLRQLIMGVTKVLRQTQDKA